MSLALLTDLYELNMAASYLRRGMTSSATFSLFVRDLPPGWGFLVACGLERCLEYLEALRFTDEDLSYLRDELGFDPEAVRALGYHDYIAKPFDIDDLESRVGRVLRETSA